MGGGTKHNVENEIKKKGNDEFSTVEVLHFVF